MSEPWTSTPHRPPLIRLITAAGRGLARLGWERELAPEPILRAATRSTGLSDFGDQRYAEGLQVLLAALNQEARLNPLGRLARSFTCSSRSPHHACPPGLPVATPATPATSVRPLLVSPSSRSPAQSLRPFS